MAKGNNNKAKVLLIELNSVAGATDIQKILSSFRGHGNSINLVNPKHNIIDLRKQIECNEVALIGHTQKAFELSQSLNVPFWYVAYRGLGNVKFSKSDEARGSIVIMKNEVKLCKAITYLGGDSKLELPIEVLIAQAHASSEKAHRNFSPNHESVALSKLHEASCGDFPGIAVASVN